MTEFLSTSFVAATNVAAWLGAIAGWQEDLEWVLRVGATIAAMVLSVVSVWYQVRRSKFTPKD